jgi:hypothetical protein
MEQATPTSGLDSYVELRKVNVSDRIEKKNNLSYLSWAFAVDELLMRDPSATWDYRFGKEKIGSGDGGEDYEVEVPYIRIGPTAMVFCTVKAFGVERTAQLPVMDHRNKPIHHPDAFQVNTAMQRALAKAIALHGLGLYIYSGEDIPPEEEKKEPPTPKVTADELVQAKELLANAESVDDLRKVFATLNAPLQAATKEYAQALAKGLS